MYLKIIRCAVKIYITIYSTDFYDLCFKCYRRRKNTEQSKYIRSSYKRIVENTFKVVVTLFWVSQTANSNRLENLTSLTIHKEDRNLIRSRSKSCSQN